MQKYQFTTDGGNTWNDMPERTPIAYTSTFPLSSSNKPPWLGDVTKGDSSYYFDVEETTLTSAGSHGNKGKANSYCRSYIPIDLTGFTSKASLSITANYTISAEYSYDIGYAAITETTSNPTSGTLINTKGYTSTNGAVVTSTKSTTIQGGKQYYLHLWYYKDGSGNHRE